MGIPHFPTMMDPQVCQIIHEMASKASIDQIQNKWKPKTHSQNKQTGHIKKKQ